MRKIIIAGFPGMGKSEAEKRRPDIFLDLESSNYHWIITRDENGKEVRTEHPTWPKNYVDLIKAIAYEEYTPDDLENVRYVCISTHKEVLEQLINDDITFIALIPKTKDIYIQRYINRGNSEEFINKLNVNFDKFVQDVSSCNVPKIYTDEYLSNLFIDEETFWIFFDYFSATNQVREKMKEFIENGTEIHFG